MLTNNSHPKESLFAIDEDDCRRSQLVSVPRETDSGAPSPNRYTYNSTLTLTHTLFSNTVSQVCLA